MKYLSFSIENYRAIKDKVTIDLKSRIIPLVGVNECGKTTILQGIFCFDYINDDENKGQHLKNIENLYNTVSDGDCIISAEIECTKEEIAKCIEKAISEKKEELKKIFNSENSSVLTVPIKTDSQCDEKSKIEDYIKLMEGVVESIGDISSVTISRNITHKKQYSCPLFSDFPDELSDEVCSTIVARMPYILYNDDFNDRPVDYIYIDKKDENGWYSIYERVFKSTNKEYSLKGLDQKDSRVRKTILSSVEKHQSKELTDVWSKFSPHKQQLSIKLTFVPNTENGNILEININDKSGNKTDSYFNVTDRSKGFIWYYNFIMKIQFNPKQFGKTNETIFLLDEPGSYLHTALQEELCKKLRDISKKEGVVIYCTHSQKLLLPKIIPINSIKLVEKSRKSHIKIVDALTKNNTKSKRNTALQPIYEALMMPEYCSEISTDKKILCVEGIYDKYCIEIFCELNEEIRILPTVSASAIKDNISYFIAYNIPYFALWDNDKEGKKELGQATKIFGQSEANHFSLLPDIHNKGKVRMEEMIECQDYTILRNALNLSENSTYEAIISGLYFSESAKKKKIINSISDETKNSFKALSSLISKKLNPN